MKLNVGGNVAVVHGHQPSSVQCLVNDEALKINYTNDYIYILKDMGSQSLYKETFACYSCD